MSKIRDITGQRFGRWTAIERDEKTDSRGNAYWLFLCDCGTQRVLMGGNITRGLSESCGCPTEGARENYNKLMPERRAWLDMRYRCTNPKSSQYRWYGERGIKICDEWINDFWSFYDHIGPRPDSYTLERIDVNGNYTPGNVRWATKLEQANNRRKREGD